MRYVLGLTRLEFENDATSQFVLDYDMQGTTVLGRRIERPSRRNQRERPVERADARVDYDRYVTLNDGKTTTTGPVWSFTAGAQGNTAPGRGERRVRDDRGRHAERGGAGCARQRQRRGRKHPDGADRRRSRARRRSR